MGRITQLKPLSDISTPEINLAITRSMVSMADDQRIIVVGNSAGQLVEFDFSSQNSTSEKAKSEKPTSRPFESGHSSYVTGVAWTKGGIVSVGYDRKMIWWDPLERTVLREIIAHDKWIRRIAVSPDGTTIATVADDMHCKLWNAISGELKFVLDDHQPVTPHHYPSMLYAVAFSASGEQLATGDKVGHIAIWETQTGRKLGELESPGMYTWDPKARRHSIGGIRSLAFSHSGSSIAVGGIGAIGNVDHLDGPARVEIFDWQQAKSLVQLSDTAMKGLVEQLHFSNDDSQLITAGGDNNGFITVYDLATNKIDVQAKAHQHLHGMIVDEASQRLYAAHHGKVSMWELQDQPVA